LSSILERFALVAGAPATRTYDAFISYSHAVDGRLAPALQRGLQRFAKPWYRTRALRVFRDETSLAASPQLWPSIQEALDRASYFILLASPEAAASPWVAREVEQWQATRPIDTLLIALTGGELDWDESRGSFDTARTTALPASLRKVFRSEPLYIDLRWAQTETEISLKHPRFRAAVARLAAPLHGVPPDVLDSEEVRQQRRTVRVARTAALLLAVLTTASVVFGVFALLQRNAARRQTALATSRGLVQAAAANRDRRLDLSILLSLAAYRARATPQARGSLISSVEETDHLVRLIPARDPVSGVAEDLRIAVDAGGDRLATTDEEGISVWDVETGKLLTRLHVRDPVAVGFADGGRIVRAATRGDVVAWRVATGATTGRSLGLPALHDATAVAFDGSGARLAAARPDGSIDVLPLGPGARELRLPAASGGLPFIASDLDFGQDGGTLAALAKDGQSVRSWNLSRRSAAFRHLDNRAKSIAPAQAGGLVAGNFDGTITVLRSSHDLRLFSSKEVVTDVALARQTRLLASVTADGTVAIWSLGRSNESFRHPLSPSRQSVTDLDFDPASGLLAASGYGRGVTIWRLNRGRQTALTPRLGTAVPGRDSTSETRVAFAPGGTLLALAEGRTVAVVSMQPPNRARRLGTTHGIVRCIAVGNGGVVAAATTDRVYLWDLAHARSLPSLPARGVVDMAFRLDGQRLVTAGYAGVVDWDLRTRTRAVVAQDAGRAVGGQRAGAVVAVGVGHSIVLWDTGDQERIGELSVPGSDVAALAFTPDGRTLAASTVDGEVLLWDVESGEQLGDAVDDPAGPVSAVAFGDGAFATGTLAGKVSFWDAVLWDDVAAMTRRLCDVVGRELTPLERREFDVPDQGERPTCEPRTGP
jgi:WD40 repeat protein